MARQNRTTTVPGPIFVDEEGNYHYGDKIINAESSYQKDIIDAYNEVPLCAKQINEPN